MSAPISSFSQLSISPSMAGTSGQRTRQQPPRDAPHDSDNDSSDDAAAGAPDDDDSEDDSGSDSDDESTLLAVDFCKEIGNYLTFIVASAEVEKSAIRIYANGKTVCTCDEAGCQHVNWLVQQLRFLNPRPATFYNQIYNVGLEQLADKMHWTFQGDDDADVLTSKWELKKQNPVSHGGPVQTARLTTKRKETVRGIMATLSPCIAEEYRTDMFDEDFSFQDMVVPRDLEATLCRILLLDDGVFYRFKDLVPAKLQASDYFYKRSAKAMHTFALFDKYVEEGPKNVEGEGEHDITWCAKVLVEIVNSINAATFESLDLEPRKQAAQALVYILQGVVNRNSDISETATWPYVARPGETAIHRNLYKLLIGSPSEFNTGRGDFLMAAFSNVRDAALDSVGVLEEIYDTIMNTPGYGASKEFLEKLNGLIRHSKSISASAAATKRPGEGMDRENKRMK